MATNTAGFAVPTLDQISDFAAGIATEADELARYIEAHGMSDEARMRAREITRRLGAMSNVAGQIGDNHE